MSYALKNSDERFCSECGKIVKAKAEICPSCGCRQSQLIPSSTKSKVSAGVLALLLGGVGIHKFYLGKIAAGFLYLLFCWTFIPSIIAFVEGILYLASSDEEFAKKYS
ncbi:MAG: NINE protein [Spirobacillus cienkowskii]|jgi:TM2 domain-containing membrane protein YozV|uniref:NINE protein n=1 Tax=Spirobacillus cienkowskii TaxID=495820 RepID=A0A369KPT0_9BACT|nr:MAG: NINE protein [Spirobacillus cienkowskii]